MPDPQMPELMAAPMMDEPMMADPMMAGQRNEPTDQFIDTPPAGSNVELFDLFPNYAEVDEVNEKTKIRLSKIFSNLSDRSDLETIWEKNDEMYRVKPDAGKDDEHRANEATGVFHISINQLQSMAFKAFTDNPDNYKFGFRGAIGDEAANIIRAKNAEIMTLLFRKAQLKSRFKLNLKRILHDCYKYGTAFVGIPWEKEVGGLIYRDKSSGDRKSTTVVMNNLPGFEHISIDRVWLDENIEDMNDQPAVYVYSPIVWGTLLKDSKKKKVALFKPEGEESLRDKFAKYIEHISSSAFSQPEQDRKDNAGRTYQDRTSERYSHWVVWINLPINKKTQTWDEDGEEVRCRVRLLGNPENCEIIEIRENIFPGGIPIFAIHQTQDDIGMYPISLGEKIETYYDQICISINQLIDNRSKNLRRPIVRDPIRVDTDKYDFGHSNVIDVQGDVRSALMELTISDMTGTIMNSIQYFEQKIREIMNTTDAVMGTAMGGRTSASEFMSAKASATTPIFSDMASIEDSLIGEYMRRFAQYIHTFMTLDDIVDQIGVVGAEFQFELTDIYDVQLQGASEALDSTTKVRNLLQLFNLDQDVNSRAKIKLRLVEAMGLENPAELVPTPAKDQAIKAALWENNLMLVGAQWDEPESGELHDVHLSIHNQALWQAQREKNHNASLMVQHIAKTQMLQRTEQAQAGVMSASIPSNGLMTNQMASSPGLESGQEIAAPMGAVNAGSPVPTEPAATPEAAY